MGLHMALETQLSSKVYDIQISGCSLKIKSDQDTGKVKHLIQMVEEKVQESLKNNSSASVQKALILSCLNFAEDHHTLKENVLKELSYMECKLQSIASQLKSKQSL